MARIAVGGLNHETNSFAAGLTELSDFVDGSIYGRILVGEDLKDLFGLNHGIGGFSAVAQAAGHELCLLSYAEAEPSGRVSRRAFDTLSGQLVEQLKSHGPVDGVYLDLHGAMMVEGDDDGDALLLERVRSHVGDGIPIVVSIDLHANMTPRFLAAADTVVAYRTYPHVDMYKTGERAAAAMSALLDGSSVHTALQLLPFMVPVNKQCTLSGAPAEIYAELDRLEQAEPDLLSLSFTFGFQCADIETPVPAAFAYARTPEAASRAVDHLIRLARSREESFGFDYVSADDASRMALAHQGPGVFILADAQDNPGGGGSGDTMFISRALRDAGANSAVVALIHDPAAAQAAHSAGIGAVLALSVGGRSVPGDSPLTGNYSVEALADGPVMTTGPMIGGLAVDLGKCARLRIDGLDILVASKRVQCLDRGYLLHLGVDPSAVKVLTIKSAVHFRSDFDQVAARVVDVLAPGFDVADFRTLPFSKLRPGLRFHGGQPKDLS